MTAKLALLKRIDQLEKIPSKAKPLRIEGGLPFDMLNQRNRATIITKSGHLIAHERRPVESAQSFLARMSKLPGTTTLGGLPPLPGTSFVSAEDSP